MTDKLELRPSASVAYSMAWLDDYRESGTTSSNLAIDDRTVRVLTARVQLAAMHELSQSSELEFRIGAQSRHTNDDDVQANLAGSDFRFANAGDEGVSGGFVGVNLRVAARDKLSMVADVEFGGASGGESYTSGHLSLQYRF